jgi:hypothetical protein
VSTKKRRAARTPRTGRPPNRHGSERLSTWVPEAVHAAVVVRARESNVSMSAWLRELLESELGIDAHEDVATKKRHTQAHLTDDQAVFVYTSPLGASAVARHLNVSRNVVYAIRNQRTYRDATDGLVQPERG